VDEDRDENKTETIMYVLAWVCVLNAVMLPMMLVMLLAHYDRQHRRQEQHYVKLQRHQVQQSQFVTKTSQSHLSVQKLEELIELCNKFIEESQPRPVSSAMRRTGSQSDSSIIGNSIGNSRRSPVFARMLANTREAPATPLYRTPSHAREPSLTSETK